MGAVRQVSTKFCCSLKASIMHNTNTKLTSEHPNTTKCHREQMKAEEVFIQPIHFHISSMRADLVPFS